MLAHGHEHQSGLEVGFASGKPPIAEVRPGALSDVAIRDRVYDVVAEHGALLLRGLSLGDVGQVAAAVRQFGLQPHIEREAFAPRTVYRDGVYASSSWPPDQPMCMHHEASYALTFPGLMMFACLTPPESGGATALADAAAVLAALPPEVVDRAERSGWELVRAYNGMVGVTAADAFGTEDRLEMERYCWDNDIELEVAADGELRTRQRRPAVIEHPRSGHRVWFNQLAFLNEWTMEPEVREYLVNALGPERLPFNTRFGDGRALDKEIVDEINKAYDRHTVREPWQAGDLLLVDNIRMAHSREPYRGERAVVVAMAEPMGPTGRPIPRDR